ncbi:MAG: YihY/virulence factor BrkB family protein [Lentisphaeria bacterium]|nr:YihY/virulence factor BrkB family protein [Lentisphaeria bacterium]
MVKPYSELNKFGKIVRITILSGKFYVRDKISRQAQALTYYTLFSIVPFAALCFGLAKGFSMDKLLKRILNERLSEHQAMLDKVYLFAETTLEHTKGGLVAGFGVLLLFFAVIRLAASIEDTFNQLWGLPKRQNLLGKLNSYITLMVVTPFLLIIVGSSTVVVQTFLTDFIMSFPGALGQWLSPLLVITKLLPYFIAWLVFTGIYFCVPNTHVQIMSAAVGGIVAGTIFQILQSSLIIIQVALSNYNTIYGSFAALPLFLLWLQWSWQITLYGAVLAYVHQHAPTGKFEIGDLVLTRRERRKYLLAITQLVLKNYAKGNGVTTISQISNTLHLPLSRARDMISELLDCKILLESADSERQPGYVPARPGQDMTVMNVFDLLDTMGGSEVIYPDCPGAAELEKACQNLHAAAQNQPDNRPLENL